MALKYSFFIFCQVTIKRYMDFSHGVGICFLRIERQYNFDIDVVWTTGRKKQNSDFRFGRIVDFTYLGSMTVYC